MEKKTRKISLVLAVVLVVLIAGAFVLTKVFTGKTESGEKRIMFSIGYSSGVVDGFEIKTDKEYLADALLERKLIEENEYQSGFYTVLNGEKASYDADKAWWCITKHGEMLNTGMNETPISDGESFEATYTIS